MSGVPPGRNFRAPHVYDRKWLRNDTPSRRDGITFEKEEEHRQAYCHLLVDVGQKLPVPQWAVGTAIYYCHRFFARKSMKTNDRFTIAVAAMFLACKVEEVSKSLETCIREFWAHRYRSRIGKSEEELKKARERIQEAKYMEQYKQSVLVAERALLYALNFDLTNCTVHGMLVPLAKEVGWADEKPLIQAAWNFVNDSLRTTVSLQATPTAIVCAVMMLTARLFGWGNALTDANGVPLWQAKQVSLHIMESIIDQICDLYTMTEGARLRVNQQQAGQPQQGMQNLHDQISYRPQPLLSSGTSPLQGTNHENAAPAPLPQPPVEVRRGEPGRVTAIDKLNNLGTSPNGNMHPPPLLQHGLSTGHAADGPGNDM